MPPHLPGRCAIRARFRHPLWRIRGRPARSLRSAAMAEPPATEPSRRAAPGPLADLRVIDLSTVLAGPGCARYLGDFGADVVKVERPGEGDTLRHMGWS